MADLHERRRVVALVEGLLGEALAGHQKPPAQQTSGPFFPLSGQPLPAGSQPMDHCNVIKHLGSPVWECTALPNARQRNAAIALKTFGCMSHECLV